MQLKWKMAAVFAALALGTAGVAFAQSDASDKFLPLVEISAHRLMIGEQVALSKWDSGTAVEDPVREALVIRDAVKKGEAKGLDAQFVANFFKAQIEANKVVQYSLLGDWHRSGRAPQHSQIDLVKTIRPELDQIQISLVEELANTNEIRSGATCHGDVARAVGKYFAKHKHSANKIHAIALDRAMAAACTM